jgi:rubredoxin-NAD+ reductase
MSDDARPLQRWLCEACGLVYDEARGDPDSGLAPGTRFEEIPEDWRCPVCGVGKADFRALGPVPTRGAAGDPADGPPPAPGATGPREATRAVLAAAARDAGVLIVGAGTAGWSVARALREAGYGGAITLTSACDGALYPKPALSVALARGLSPVAIVERAGPDFARELSVRLYAHCWAVELDRARRRLVTTRGTLRYASLVLATGGRARRPVLPGPGASRLFAINDLAAYAALRAAFEAARDRAAAQRRAPRLAIIGAGLVGCELADDFAGAGAEVTLLEAAALPLGGRVDAGTAGRLRDALAARGVRFAGGVTVDDVRVPADARSEDAQLNLAWRDPDGCATAERFDLGVLAVGVDPETRLARRAGLAVARGIVVDPGTLACLDSAPASAAGAPRCAGIWALGDCAEIDGRVGGTVEPILRQARTIAGAIVGRPEPFAAREPVWVLKTPSLPLTIRPPVASPAS